MCNFTGLRVNRVLEFSPDQARHAHAMTLARNVAAHIEIINNTRGGIEGKIEERVVWGTNSSPGCSLIHDVPDKKVVFRQMFLLFKLFFPLKY